MDLVYTIQRSAQRRKLTITVERDRSVVVHAPEGISDEEVEKRVHAKRQWIYEKINHPQKYRELPHAPGKELVSGESALYLGRRYRIEVVDVSLTGIQLDQHFAVPAVPAKERVQAMRAWYVTQADEIITPRVAMHAHALGVVVAGVKIVDSHYRWGSCTVKDIVTFNWRLIKAPMFVIDYVIVHELAHLIESNHTARFWNVVRAQSPAMEKAKAWLKENGQLLEEIV
jgi:predicted metal-dependent hydrolase